MSRLTILTDDEQNEFDYPPALSNVNSRRARSEGTSKRNRRTQRTKTTAKKKKLGIKYA